MTASEADSAAGLAGAGTLAVMFAAMQPWRGWPVHPAWIAQALGFGGALFAVTAPAAVAIVERAAAVARIRVRPAAGAAPSAVVMFLMFLLFGRVVGAVAPEPDMTASLRADLRFAVRSWPMTACWLVAMTVAAALVETQRPQKSQRSR